MIAAIQIALLIVLVLIASALFLAVGSHARRIKRLEGRAMRTDIERSGI